MYVFFSLGTHSDVGVQMKYRCWRVELLETYRLNPAFGTTARWKYVARMPPEKKPRSTNDWRSWLRYG